MRPPRPHSTDPIPRCARRRGAALLLVLALTAAAVPALAVTALSAASLSLASRHEHRALLAEHLLAAAEAPLLEWLGGSAAVAVVPPDSGEPRIGVLHHGWLAGGHSVELRITAWDQQGMVPLGAAARSAALRSALPRSALGVLDALGPAADDAPGLDLLAAAAGAGACIYPSAPATSEPVRFGAAALRAGGGEAGQSTPGIPPAAGALLATHNTPTPARGRAGARPLRAGALPVVVNVNTAPRALLEAALRSEGRGGLEAILTARGEGRPFNPGRLRSAASRAGEGRIRLVGTSASWSVRIDVSVRDAQRAGHGATRRSIWAVYARGGDGWERVQQLVIDR